MERKGKREGKSTNYKFTSYLACREYTAVAFFVVDSKIAFPIDEI